MKAVLLRKVSALSKAVSTRFEYCLFQIEFETAQQLKKEEKERTKREKTAVVGDVHPMLDALSDLSAFLDDVRTEQRKKEEKYEFFRFYFSVLVRV